MKILREIFGDLGEISKELARAVTWEQFITTQEVSFCREGSSKQFISFWPQLPKGMSKENLKGKKMPLKVIQFRWWLLKVICNSKS